MSDPKTDIWMPLFIGDYLADTTRLTTVQHGAYLLLIMDYWRNGSPPDDDEILANITKMQIKDWLKIKLAVMKLFKLVDGFYIHKRIDQELSDALTRNEKAKAKAKKAADSRWGKDGDKHQEKSSSSNPSSNAPSIPSSNTNGMLEDKLEECPSPSPSLKPSVIDTQSVNSTTTDLCVSPGEVCKAMKYLGIQDVNPTNPKLIALIKAGASKEEFINATTLAKVRKFSYILGTVEGMRKQAAEETLTQGKSKPKGFGPSTADSTITAKAKELNISLTGLSRYQAIEKVNNAMGVS